MVFEITMSGADIPLEIDAEDIAAYLLYNVGIVTTKTRELSTVKNTPQYNIFMNFLMKGGGSIKEIAKATKLTLPAVYRHISKFENLDIIEYVPGDGNEKLVSLKYNSLTKAWKFVNLNIDITSEIYGKICAHIDSFFKDTYGVDFDTESVGGWDVSKDFVIVLDSNATDLFDWIKYDGINENNIDSILKELYKYMGLVSERGILDKGEKSAVRIFSECFLRHPDKWWTYDELCGTLGLSRSTVYRVITKVSSIGFIDTTETDGKVAYRMKWAGLKTSWNMISSYHIRYIKDMYFECARSIESKLFNV